MNEPVHVYQNRKDTYHVIDMHYCPVCNGYYGVPHVGCATRGGCANDPKLCACRFHRELLGLKRQGEYGWIVHVHESVDGVNTISPSTQATCHHQWLPWLRLPNGSDWTQCIECGKEFQFDH